MGQMTGGTMAGNAMAGNKRGGFFSALADYSGASPARREYDKQRKDALLNDPGSWTYRSFADWKKKNKR